MSESIEAFNELRAIRSRVEAIEHTQEILIRAHAKEILAEVFARFDEDHTLARVYLLVDGKRTQDELAKALREEGFSGASAASISRKLDILSNDLALVELADRTRAGKTYRKTAADRILGLSRNVSRRLSDDPNRRHGRKRSDKV